MGSATDFKESVRAKLRALVRRILRNHGYYPALQAKATVTVLHMSELSAVAWAAYAGLIVPSIFHTVMQMEWL